MRKAKLSSTTIDFLFRQKNRAEQKYSVAKKMEDMEKYQRRSKIFGELIEALGLVNDYRDYANDNMSQETK